MNIDKSISNTMQHRVPQRRFLITVSDVEISRQVLSVDEFSSCYSYHYYLLLRVQTTNRNVDDCIYPAVVISGIGSTTTNLVDRPTHRKAVGFGTGIIGTSHVVLSFDGCYWG